MNYTLYYSDIFQRHLVPVGHPECPDRLSHTIAYLKQQDHLSAWQWVEAPQVDFDWFEYAHPKTYIDQIVSAIPRSGLYHMDGDTCLSPITGQALRCAGGALKSAIDDQMEKNAGVSLCLSRPPGHHAERERAMGFCFFGSVANAALYAKSHYQIERVAVLDFDVHHGNGTEDILRSHEDVLFASSYQEGIFPGGTQSSLQGNRIFMPMASDTDSNTFRSLWNEYVFQNFSKSPPELIIVSAGFDAHKNDPLASLNLDETDFLWLGEQIRQLAHLGGNKIVAYLEGGYHISSLSRCVARFMEGLEKEPSL